MATIALALVVARTSVVGQELEPRSYVNTPVGLNFLVVGYGFSEGGVATDPSLPIEGGEIEAHLATLAYARSFGLGGTSGKFSVVLPYGWVSGSAMFQGEPRSRSINGVGDPRLRFTLNLYGAPALSLDEFRRHEHDSLVVGASFQVTLPLGQHDADKLVNIGTNRWSFKPELGLSKSWRRFTLELAGAAAFYTTNDEFLGDMTFQQDPLFSVQSHLVYTFAPSLWGALDFTYYAGGDTKIDGERSRSLQENTRFGATIAVPLGRHFSLKLYGSTGLSARTGSDFDTVGAAWQARWGGGL